MPTKRACRQLYLDTCVAMGRKWIFGGCLLNLKLNYNTNRARSLHDVKKIVRWQTGLPFAYDRTSSSMFRCRTCYLIKMYDRSSFLQ